MCYDPFLFSTSFPFQSWTDPKAMRKCFSAETYFRKSLAAFTYVWHKHNHASIFTCTFHLVSGHNIVVQFIEPAYISASAMRRPWTPSSFGLPHLLVSICCLGAWKVRWGRQHVPLTLIAQVSWSTIWKNGTALVFVWDKKLPPIAFMETIDSAWIIFSLYLSATQNLSRVSYECVHILLVCREDAIL